MWLVSILVGVVLIAVGLGGWIESGSQAPTALIPAGIGILLLACGVVARWERLRMHAMHVAVVVALLGFLGCLRGVLQLPALFAHGPVLRPLAVVSQSITGAILLGFVLLCVRSFVQTRRARTAGTGERR